MVIGSPLIRNCIFLFWHISFRSKFWDRRTNPSFGTREIIQVLGLEEWCSLAFSWSQNENHNLSTYLESQMNEKRNVYQSNQQILAKIYFRQCTGKTDKVISIPARSMSSHFLKQPKHKQEMELAWDDDYKYCARSTLSSCILNLDLSYHREFT